MSANIYNAKPGEIADTVLMPGDPLRAKYIAEKFLDDARQVTDVRNMLGFTGFYKGRKLSVVAHGIGIPSATVYCTDLITQYGVKRILRVGSCGTVSASVGMRDNFSPWGFHRLERKPDPLTVFRFRCPGRFELLENVVSAARSLGASFHVTNVLPRTCLPAPGQ